MQKSLLHTSALAWLIVPAVLGVSATAAQAAAEAPPVCVSGAWTPVEVEANAPVQYQTAHFAFRWKTGDVKMADAEAAGVKLEEIWSYYMGPVAFAEPYCDTAIKHKANVNLDPTFGLTGGPTGERDMGMWIGPPALKDNWGLAHEFAHALQGSTRAMRDSPYSGWLWESHANWMTHQMPEFHRTEVHCSEMLVNYPHIYYGSTRDRYCNWQFLEYVKDEYGYKAVNDIWLKAKKIGEAGYESEDPFSVLARNMGWSLDDLNDAFGAWALYNANWDYVDPDGHDQGVLYLTKYGTYDQRQGDRALRVTRLDPVDAAKGRYAVPAAWAPQRWGYNIVQLVPDAGAKQITVTFKGVVQAASATAALPGLNNEPDSIGKPGSDWRWGVVALDAKGESRLSPLMGGADGELIFPVKPDDQAIYMVVTATPSSLQKIKWDQPYYSIYRYPWMAQFAGARPQDHEAGAANPTKDGHRHKNGGGWVAAGARVDDTAYVGPYAQVLGGKVTEHARIEDHAIIINGSVSGHAVVGALTILDNGVEVKDNAVVATTFKGPGAFEPGTVVSGTAQIRGDAEVRGGPKLAHGVYYGFVDQASETDPKQGSTLTAPVPEVTAAPVYRWPETVGGGH